MNGGAWGIRNRGGGAYNPDCEEHAERMHELVRQEKRDSIRYPVFVRAGWGILTGAKIYDQDQKEVPLETICDAVNAYFDLRRKIERDAKPTG